MKLKSLMLGSAAAVMVAGGAQAADLTIGESVEYVRVCDAFGVGYWYIPGTDTCIKVGGSVQMDLKFKKGGWTFGTESNWIITGEDSVIEDISATYSTVVEHASFFTITVGNVANNGGNTVLNNNEDITYTQVVQDISTDETDVLQGTEVDSDLHHSHWKFVTEAVVNFTAKSMTEYGALVAHIALKGVADQGTGTTFGDNVYLDTAYLSLGHLTLGYLGSVQNGIGGFAPGAFVPDTKTNQVNLSWAAAGFGIALGIEDPSKRWGTDLVDGNDDYQLPDMVAAITVAQGHWDAKATGGIGWIEDQWTPTWDNALVYGIGGTVTAGMDPFKIRAGGSFGTGTSFVGDGLSSKLGFTNGTSMWTAFISGIVQASPTFSIAGTFAYASQGSVAGTRGGAKLVWAPVPGFEAYAEGSAWKLNSASEHVWEAKVGAKRSF